MAKDKGKGKDDDEKKKDEKNRGTQDELEILALVIQQNLAVRMSVLEKLRAAKERVAKKAAKATPTSA